VALDSRGFRTKRKQRGGSNSKQTIMYSDTSCLWLNKELSASHDEYKSYIEPRMYIVQAKIVHAMFC